jgi:pimeloyl-ACP methyl ester carboxylesterase
MAHCPLTNVELFYVEKGQGEPLLFLNGLSGDHLYWMGQVRAFSKRYRCLALDNRDVGQSRGGSRPYTTAELAGDVAALMEHLQLPPAHIVGLSMGGMIAQELALAQPERVRSLVLVDSLARADEWFQGTLRAFEMIRRQVADTPSFFEAILPWWVSWRFFEQSERITWLRWLLRQTPYPQSLDGFLRQLEATRCHDTLDRLSGIACPVLVLVGAEDAVCPPRYSQQLRDGIPDAQLTVVSGVGHALPFEDPGQFTSLVDAFLSTRGASDRRCA